MPVASFICRRKGGVFKAAPQIQRVRYATLFVRAQQICSGFKLSAPVGVHLQGQQRPQGLFDAVFQQCDRG